LPSYAYKGLDASGRTVSGHVEAEGPRSARQRLRDQGLFVSSLEDEAQPRSKAAGKQRNPGTVQLARNLRQLGTLLRAGIPLVESVTSLRGQALPAHRWIWESLRRQLVEGSSLADSMASQPGVFPSMYIGMIRAGEASGTLDEVLDRVASYAEDSARWQARLRSAMTYPLVMAVTGTAIVVFLLAYVVPQITRVFVESQQTLPLPTRALMALADLLVDYGLLGLLLLIAAFGLLRWYWRSPSGRRRLEGVALSVPVLGTLRRNLYGARFCHTLSATLSGGLPLVDALEITRGSVGSELMSDLVGETAVAVRGGGSLAGALKNSPLVHPLVVDMAAAGERSGELENLLERAAEAMDEEVDSAVQALSAMMEPAVVLVMAGMVLFVLLAVMLPVFEMNQLVR